MIARLTGRPAGVRGDALVVDVGGVGYLVTATQSALRRAQGADEVALEIYTHVREDALQLYGFAEPAERELFEHLLSVSGVGPKVALAIVSGSTPADLRRAIALEDITRFVAIPGIGKKTAQRVVLELREKLGAEAPAEGRSRAAPLRSWSPATRSSSSASRRSRPSRRSRAWIPSSSPRSASAWLCERRHDRIAVPGACPPDPGRGRARALAAAALPGRLRRAGADQGAALDRSAGGEEPRRGARSRSARRPARPGQDQPGLHRPRRARRRAPLGRRPGDRAQGRHRRDPDRARGARRPLRRRDPPALARGRGDPLPGAGGLPARHRARAGPGGANPHAGPAEFHARGRHDADGPADHAAPRPLRHDLPARVLRAGRARD